MDAILNYIHSAHFIWLVGGMIAGLRILRVYDEVLNDLGRSHKYFKKYLFIYGLLILVLYVSTIRVIAGMYQ